MEWILTAIIAPLVIAGVVAVFRLRGMVWLVGRPLYRRDIATPGRLFQSLTVFNAGGQTEDDISLRFPDRLEIELAASTEGVAKQEGSVITVPFLASGDQCQLLVLSAEEIGGATPLTLRSKGVKRGSYAKSEKEVATAANLGGWLIILILVLSAGFLLVRLMFFSEEPTPVREVRSPDSGSAFKSIADNAGPAEKKWSQWDSVGDFPGSELAKFYPAPASPIAMGEFSRRGDVATVPVIFNNVSPFPVKFTASLSSSITAEDPEPWERRDSVRNLVVAPASQQQVLLSTYYPGKTQAGYLVFDGFIEYADDLHQFSKNVRID